jgi:hypothetical protein
MFHLTIKKQGIVTNGPSPFETEELVLAHVAREEANKTYGETDKWVNENDLSDDEKLEYPVTRKVIIKEASAGSEAVLDEYGNILEEAKDASEEVSYLEHFIPKKYEVIIEDVTLIYEKNKRIEEIAASGLKAAMACEKAFNLISGYNQKNNLSVQQIQQMAHSFGSILQALAVMKMPATAKVMISAVDVDGVLVTQDLKDDLLEILKEF